jgi:hypothetical protein
MNPITAATQAIRVRRLTRKYQELNKLNAAEQCKADKAAIAARLNDQDLF